MRRTRSRLAVVQAGVFVCGGILAPATHLAWHRPDHSHGSAGRELSVEVGAHGRAEHRNADAPGDVHGVVPRRPGTSHHSHDHGHGHPSAQREDGEHARPPANAEPLDAIHGHGSIAHFGLALLSAAPPLTLPTPEPAGVLPRPARPRAAALFRPSFPLPRPPPPATVS